MKRPKSISVEVLVGFLMPTPTSIPVLLGSTGADKWRALHRHIRSRLQIVSVVLLLLRLLLLLLVLVLALGMIIHICIILLPSVQVFMELTVVADVFLVVGVLQLNPYVGFFAGNQVRYGNFKPAITPAKCCYFLASHKAGMLAETHIGRKTDGETHRETGRQAGRQADGQTEAHRQAGRTRKTEQAETTDSCS